MLPQLGAGLPGHKVEAAGDLLGYAEVEKSVMVEGGKKREAGAVSTLA